MRLAEALLSVSVTLLAFVHVRAATDEDFYGQSPPVYPSRKYSVDHAQNTCSKLTYVTLAAGGKGTGVWASAYTSARALISQMTLEEKVNITGGFSSSDNACNGNTGGAPRLGWSGLCLQDAGNGVRGVDLTNSYPSGIHVGASWDKTLTYRRGLEMGNEFRVKGGW